MSESDQEHQDQAEGQGDDEQSTDEFVQDMEDDPSTAGGPDHPADELRGG